MAETPNTPGMEPIAGARLNHASPAQSPAASIVERRLSSDGERWARALPAANALTAWVDALPEPSADARQVAPEGEDSIRAIRSTRGAPVADMADMTIAPDATPPQDSSGTGRHSTAFVRFRSARLVATVAAVLVVALMATLFVALAGGGRSIGLGRKPGATATRATPTTITATLGVFPGPQAQQVRVLISNNSDVTLNPADTTTRFQVGDHVYIAVILQHASGVNRYPLTVVWFLNGQRLSVSNVMWSPPYADSYKPTFAVNQVYDAPGVGMAKVYLNAQNPASPNDDSALAQTAIFIVQ